MDTNLNYSGMEGLGDMSWGTHFCLFYETERDLLETLAHYFKTGIANHEFCLWITPDSSNDKARNTLRQVIPAADQHLEDGNIEVLSCQEWYGENNEFDAARVIERFDTKLTQALEKGYARMRVLADEAWLDEQRWKVFSDYERKIDERFAGKLISIICAYPTTSHNAADILDVARTHRFITVRRKGNWEILESPELKHAKAEPATISAELDAQVAEKEKSLSLRETPPSTLLRYAIPIIAVVVSLAGTFLLQPYVFRTPLFFLSILISTWVGGIGPGLLAVLLSTLVINLFLSPAGILETRFQNILNPISFLITALLVSSWSETRRRAEQSLRKARAELETKVQERIVGLRQMNQALQAEIIDHKRAEEALRQSENNFRTLAEKSLEGIQLYQDGRSVYANAAMTAIMGYTEEEFKAMSMEEHITLVHPLDRAIAVERARRRQAGQEVPASLEVRIITKSGTTRWVQGFTNEIEYNGQPAILSTAIDITDRKRAEDAIRKSEQVLREAESLGHTGSWEQDLVTGEIFNTEENLRLFFGDDRSKGANFEDYAQAVHPDDREYVLRRHTDLFEEEGPSDIEYRVVWPDGNVHVIFGRATVVRDELNQPIRVYGTNVDITERKRAEEETKHQAARAETLARIAASLNKQLDLDAVIHAVCEEAINTFKVSQATMSLYDKKSDLLVYVGGINISPEYAASMEPITGSRFDDFVRAIGPIMVVPDIQSLPDVPNAEFSSHLDVRTVVTAAMLRDQELIGALVVGVNGYVREFDQDELTLLKAISDQAAQAIANAQLLKAANEQHEQLRALSTKLVEVQETERRALTTELHDRVGQNITGLSISLQNMKAILPSEIAQQLATKFNDAQALVEDTSRQIRDIMAELHPSELEDYGLAVALETYAEQAASRGNLELIADLPDLAPPLPPSDVRIALFRAAQEAISNVLKHANATQLKVSLTRRNGRINLTVEDNGKGFELASVAQKEAQTWGLKIMRERIESIGGKVQIESEPGEGTLLTFEIERTS